MVSGLWLASGDAELWKPRDYVWCGRLVVRSISKCMALSSRYVLVELVDSVTLRAFLCSIEAQFEMEHVFENTRYDL